MKWFASHAKKLGKYTVKYYENDDIPSTSNESWHVFDPIDYPIIKKLQKKFGNNLHIHESPNFIATKSDLNDYYQKVKNNKIQQHHTFYNWQKKRINELVNVKSYDKLNRKRLPKNTNVPSLPTHSTLDIPFIKEAEKYIALKYPNGIGPITGLIFPISRKSSLHWFNNFLKNRFKHFGDYQDFIDTSNPFLFHSTISPMLNIGLLTAKDVLKGAQKVKKRNQVSIASYEGFIRQIIGWREYVRFLYTYFRKRFINSNHFGNTKKLTKAWYTGSTGIQPVDDAIKTGFKYGYLHHIPRLMIMCNFMNLYGIHPKEIYRWFMEFSCDSYEWVMVPNIFGMGTFADGGFMMRKVYISSSAYIFRMSNYSKSNEKWYTVWDKLYRKFVKTHRINRY
jgi:deoxyribodipyrimidine photolyase-related protein